MKCFSKQRKIHAGLITLLRHVNWLALTCCKYRNRNFANITKTFKTCSTFLYPIFLKIFFRWKSRTQGFHWAEGMSNVQNANDTRPEVLLIFQKISQQELSHYPQLNKYWFLCAPSLRIRRSRPRKNIRGEDWSSKLKELVTLHEHHSDDNFCPAEGKTKALWNMMFWSTGTSENWKLDMAYTDRASVGRRPLTLKQWPPMPKSTASVLIADLVPSAWRVEY